MTWKERLQMAWRFLTHKPEGHEFWGCVRIGDLMWDNADEALIVMEASRECNHLAEDMRRQIVSRHKASRA